MMNRIKLKEPQKEQNRFRLMIGSRNLTPKRLAQGIVGVVLCIGRILLIAGLCFVLLYPLLYMFSMAFRPTKEILDPSVVWIPKTFTLDNLRLAWELMDYGSVFRNTLLINIISSLLQVATCAVTSYAFARFQFKGKQLLFGIVIFSIMIPSQLTIIPLSRSFSHFDFFGIGQILKLFGAAGTVNLLDTPAPFYISALFGAGIKSGMFIFIFRQFFRGLPKELEEASAIDGCGFVKTFLRIILPNAVPVCVSSVILSVVWYWNDYYYSSMYVPNMPTVSLMLSGLPSRYASIYNAFADSYETVTLMQAGALLTIVPVLVMYIFLQRKLVQGMERSGLVG